MSKKLPPLQETWMALNDALNDALNEVSDLRTREAEGEDVSAELEVAIKEYGEAQELYAQQFQEE